MPEPDEPIIQGAAVLRVGPVFLGLFRLAVDKQPEGRRPHDAHQPIERHKPRREVRKGRADGLDRPDELFTEASARRQTIGRPHFQAGPQDKQIR